MTYIKKLVMQGFKSFPKKTEIPFTPGINVILGPNGSGKSNVSDGLCFVLGRLSAKSMRAAKSENLIFLGTSAAGPAKEAIVEIVFDNSDGTFSVPEKEIAIKRIVRKNGQSIYKINGETKTRQEILTLLAQAGIDPNGFNIILQGEIQNFVRMHTDERRKVIEEVAGISIYESRKEKSLKELEKTEEKLKEVIAVLRERTAYLNNLEKERQEALRFQKLQSEAKRMKASIIYFDLSRKKKEADNVISQIENKSKQIEKTKKEISEIEEKIKSFELKISEINQKIQQATGLEQEKLNSDIANIRANIMGDSVRLENHEKKLSELEKRRSNLNEIVRNNELSLKELQKESPDVIKKQKIIEEKKKELEKLEDQRKKFYMTKSELKSLRDRINDKKTSLQSYMNESDFIIKQIDNLSTEIYDIKTTSEKVANLKRDLNEKRETIDSLKNKLIELDKIIHTNNNEIDKHSKIIDKIAKMDICPLCKSKITENHIKEIHGEVKPEMDRLTKEVEDSKEESKKILEKINNLTKEREELSSEITKRESDLVKLSSVDNKKEQIKSLQEKINLFKSELFELDKRRKFLEDSFDENSNIEEKYENARLELNDISIRTEENVNSEMAFKQKEIEKDKFTIKQINEEEKEISSEINLLKKSLNEKEKILLDKRKQEEELTEKFKKFILQRDGFQAEMRNNEKSLTFVRTSFHNLESDLNNFKIDKARIDAEIENYEIEMLEFPDVEIIKSNKDVLIDKLAKLNESISRIGSVNLRSLEVYDSIKAEYDRIKEKVDIITKEKEDIIKVIHEIDIKKKKTFLKTLSEINDIFSRNFAQISTKGQVSLELENQKDPFEGGVGIQVKTGHGKYFDVTSLSGGEQTMVALSLIFAIQELKPYAFYVLDEIDAALDKRNSERLAVLLKRYMQKGQYIVISHNDEIITNSNTLFGVSMHDGISKIVSLKL